MRIFLLVLLLLLAVTARAEGTRTVHNSERTNSVTLEKIECKGTSRAIVVTVSGDRAKGVRYGDKEFYELANELSVSGYGHVAIYGLQLGDGESVEDVVVQLEGSQRRTVVIHSLTDVNQAIPFGIPASGQGYKSKLRLVVSDTYEEDRLVGAFSISQYIPSLSRVASIIEKSKRGKTTIEKSHVDGYWTIAVVIVRSSEAM
jgi:hypothetical protein